MDQKKRFFAAWVLLLMDQGEKVDVFEKGLPSAIVDHPVLSFLTCMILFFFWLFLIMTQAHKYEGLSWPYVPIHYFMERNFVL